MTHTIEAPLAAAPAAATSVPARILLAGGVVAGPLFLGAGLIQGLSRDGFDFTRNAISQLSLGGTGWIQVTSFSLTGALLVVGAVGMRRALRGEPGGVWAPRLIAVFGASFLLSAVFAADPGAGFPAGAPDARTTSMSWHGTLHMLSGMVGHLALCAAFFVLARHFAAGGHRGWAVGSRLVPFAVLAGFAGSSATVAAFTIGAGLGLLGLAAVTARLLKA
ncbi:DUF998 domain-containing protein [Streptomyces spectabilis]|uniref:DUF998 domain-containing protein n=1 Tax=Streptomyces spectabilis TaxID=68270 RepID=A0A5P2X5H0_STRST|nr:DUF998 domain-containing protein [Streptomyces spectabilis]MBB5107331.1 putative membrane protein [Streptomyces spectabilis]MCI3900022.1 DUF998 domain-containing protein [Streptomyces spectabilis]QEV57652.1 DUF998 domain-containing protein [Streptomyces spectabilis]GGV36902.1 hypothetical protein GCM10010245_58800 [Streptomyces spectabilis]